MNLVDIKHTKEDKKAEANRWKGDSEVDQMEDYPYGLRIHLNDETISKLGLTDADLDAGEPVSLVAEAIIAEDSVVTVNGKTRRSMSLQIQKIAVTQGKNQDDVATTLYGA